MKHTNYILGLVLLLLATACSKSKLEPVPQQNILFQDAFSTAQRTEQTVLGLYSSSGLKNGQFYGSRYIVYQDIRAEEFLNVTNNGVTGLVTWNFTTTPTTNEVQNFWDAAYAGINRVNVVLANLDAAPVTAAVRANYRGEAKFIRAISYFALTQLYCRPFNAMAGANLGVPLRLTAQTNLDSGANALARSTVAQVYSRILIDLDSAELELPVTGTPTRATRNTAIALKIRIKLAMNDWAGVNTEVAKLYTNTTAPFTAGSGNANALESNVANVYLPNYTGGEVLLTMPFTTLDLPGTQNGLANYWMPGPVGAGEYSLNTAGIIGNAAFRAAGLDARRSFLFNTTGAVTRTWLRKFPNNPQVDFAPVIRWPEVLLAHAEALTMSTASVNTTAINLLNAVKRRSDPTFAYVPADFATATDLRNAILLERRIEFLGEGHRTYDITRTLSPFPAKGTISAVPTTSAAYIWPIPQNELITNRLCVQN
jgi:starch-binding outer membrane protein, SusD/RagB family